MITNKNILENPKLQKFYVNLIIVFVFAFISLCLLHYFSQRDLWLDEDAVLENIKTLSSVHIFDTLKRSQAFPRIYLLLIKYFSGIFSYSLLSLRFFSLIFMQTAFFLWIYLYKKEFQENLPFLLAIMSFACSYQLSYYSSELKPYSMDVLVVGTYCLFFYYQKQFDRNNPTRQLFVIASILPLLIFFSYAGLFVFWIVIYNFILQLKYNRKLWFVALVNFLISIICFCILYNIDLKFSVYHKALLGYWKDYFLSLKSFVAFLTPFGEGLREIITWWFGNTRFSMRVATPLIPIFLYSIIRYGFNKLKFENFRIFNIGTLFAVLLVELIILSIFRKYPFTGERVTLFLSPFVFYLIAKGINDLKKIKVAYYVYLLYYSGFMFACLIYGITKYLSLYK